MKYILCSLILCCTTAAFAASNNDHDGVDGSVFVSDAGLDCAPAIPVYDSSTPNPEAGSYDTSCECKAHKQDAELVGRCAAFCGEPLHALCVCSELKNTCDCVSYEL